MPLARGGKSLGSAPPLCQDQLPGDPMNSADTRARVNEALLGGEIDIGEILDLNACLKRLAELEPRHAQLVELRVFAGMTMAECATHLGTSLRTAERDWRVASAWLRRELARSTEKTQDT